MGGTATKRWSGRKLTEWRARKLREEPLCRHCRQAGRVTAAAELDHVIPLERGGTYDDENICPLCADCHKAKTAKDRGYRIKPRIGEDGWPIDG